MNKKELKKVKPGTLLRIKWDDSEDTVAMLVDTPDWNNKGDISLRCFQVNDKGIGYTDSHIQHSQVIEILSPIDKPFTQSMLNHQNSLE